MQINNLDILKNQLSSIPDENQLGSTRTNKNLKRNEAENVAQEFETLFAEMMLKTMRETAKPEDESNAENIYRGMLDSEYAKLMSGSQSLGLKDMILNWITENDASLKASSEAPKVTPK